MELPGRPRWRNTRGRRDRRSRCALRQHRLWRRHRRRLLFLGLRRDLRNHALKPFSSAGRCDLRPPLPAFSMLTSRAEKNLSPRNLGSRRSSCSSGDQAFRAARSRQSSAVDRGRLGQISAERNISTGCAARGNRRHELVEDPLTHQHRISRHGQACGLLYRPERTSGRSEVRVVSVLLQYNMCCRPESGSAG